MMAKAAKKAARLKFVAFTQIGGSIVYLRASAINIVFRHDEKTTLINDTSCQETAAWHVEHPISWVLDMLERAA